MKKKFINEGGVNGQGEGLVNTNSTDFKGLQDMIKRTAENRLGKHRLADQFLSIRFQMESYLESESDEVIMTGTFIKKYLEVLSVKQKDFAEFLSYEASNFNALLNGRRKVNPTIALKLGSTFKVDPLLWLYIETKNEVRSVQKNSREDFGAYNLNALLNRVA